MKCKKMAALVLGLLLSLGALAGCAGEPAMAEDSPPLLFYGGYFGRRNLYPR